MNELDLQSSITGALISSLIWLVVYLFKKNQRSEEKAIDSIPILVTEIATLKTELRAVRDAYAIVTSAAKEIILLRAAVDAAWKAIDELRKSIEALDTIKNALQLIEISNDDHARMVIGRLHLLKRAVESIGGHVDQVKWVDPEESEKGG